MPPVSGEVTFRVIPAIFGDASQTVAEYTLKLRPIPLSAKPVLMEQGQWTKDDPTYRVFGQDTGKHFKAYKLPMKAGRLYVIDLVKGGPGIDPYLYLEGADGKVVISDDDSGGDLNARIVYAPVLNGEFRIIATTLNSATGEFTLKVREAE
jgi:hypothetical protein